MEGDETSRGELYRRVPKRQRLGESEYDDDGNGHVQNCIGKYSDKGRLMLCANINDTLVKVVGQRQDGNKHPVATDLVLLDRCGYLHTYSEYNSDLSTHMCMHMCTNYTIVSSAQLVRLITLSSLSAVQCSAGAIRAASLLSRYIESLASSFESHLLGFVVVLYGCQYGLILPNR